MRRLTLAALLLVASSSPVLAGDWPAFRGPNGNGISDETGVPTQWSKTENITWQTPLPTGGNSSPIVWGDRVFLTIASKDGAQRSLMCFNRDTGAALWTKTVEVKAGEPTHGTNPYGASSPTTDGKLVYVWHGTGGIHAYDFDGNEKWSKELGTFTHIWGYASSPVLYKNLVILSAGPGLEAFLVAFDKATGEEKWRNPLPGAQSDKPEQFKGSWSTPVFRHSNGRDELVIGLPKKLHGIDPNTGKVLWTCDGLSDLVYTSAVAAGDIAIAMCGYGGPAIAVEAVGDGDLTAKRLWLHPKNKQRIGTGVVIDGHLHMLNEPGTFMVIELKTGDVKFEEKLCRNSWSSLTYVDGRIYAIDDRAKSYILKPSLTGIEILQENDLAEQTRSTPAFSDGQIFIRTYNNLYCIGTRKRAAAAQ